MGTPSGREVLMWLVYKHLGVSEMFPEPRRQAGVELLKIMAAASPELWRVAENDRLTVIKEAILAAQKEESNAHPK